MSIDSIVRAYLRRLQRAVIDTTEAGAGSLELATRPVVSAHFLETVVSAIKPGAVVHNELHAGRGNRPDWRIDDPDTFGVYAYGDHKGLTLSGPLVLTQREKDQIERYIGLGRPVFVFDGIELLFYWDHHSPPERIELVPKPLDVGQDWSKLPIDPAAEIRLRSLLKSPGFRKWTEADLMEQLAGRARLISTSVAALLEAPTGSGSTLAEEELLGALRSLHDLARTNHDPGLTDPKSCADFIAQVLVFGLFYAHTTAPDHGDSPDERRQHIKEFWQSDLFGHLAEKLRPFRTIVHALGNSLSTDNELHTWYSEVGTVLAHAEYMGTKLEPIDFHSLFERFFVSFDKEARFERGVFYTPTPVTDWMIRVTDQLLQTHFGGGIGAVVDKLIDPCCGTGGFLESALTAVGDVPNGPHLIGFEVLPAPYALAHYRLTAVSKGWQHTPNVSIALTDTLSDRLADPPPQGDNGFSDELAAAADWAHPPVKVVIGNPPSSIHNFSEAPRTVIEQQIEDFRPPPEVRHRRQNTQQGLRNEAVRFLRWGAREVIDSGSGVIALVLPGAFAHKVSYAYAREWLLKQFDHLYALMLDRDLRTGQSTGQSMFEVQQGRMILFGVRTREPSTPIPEISNPATVLIHDIRDLSRGAKLAHLNAKLPLAETFTPVEVSGPQWLFQKKSDKDPSGLWASCWPLHASADTAGVFRSRCSAVKLAPTALMFHTDPIILERRSLALGSRSATNWMKTPEELRVDWWLGQSKPPNSNKFTDAVRLAISAAAKEGQSIKPYTFRPFVDGFVVCNDNLFAALKSAPGDGTRARPEIRAAFDQGARGIAVAPDPVDLGSSLTRFSSFCWHLPDNDICARQSARVYCDVIPAEKRGRQWDSTAHDNLNSEVSSLFREHRDTLYYVYAVMNCPIYLETFKEILYRPGDPESPPRIPIAESVAARNKIAQIGQLVAECERPGPTLQDMGIATTWTAEVGELKLERYSVNSTDGSVTLFGTDGVSIDVREIPNEVLTLRIAGHDVIDKWLRERKYPYLRRSFRRYDLEQFIDLVTRIATQLSLLDEVAALLAPVLSSGQLLQPPKLAN